jgi:type VII secretion-associated serine protease mycosin
MTDNTINHSKPYAPLACRLLFAILVILTSLIFAPEAANAQTTRQAEWHLDALDIPRAHAISRGAGVTVAVIDSGVNPTAAALQDRLLPGSAFGVASPRGQTDTDPAGHGTGVASIIAGSGGPDGTDMLGVAPDARILPIAAGGGDSIAKSIRWAVDHDSNVINISLSVAYPGPEMRSALRYAFEHDVVVVAAAGNTFGELSSESVTEIAKIPGVVAVSGVDRNANFWSGSSHGPEVSISAPAVDVVNSLPKPDPSSKYALGKGTSFSSPIVAGTAALIRAKYPKLNAPSVINRLIRTAKSYSKSGRDEYYGFGTVRPYDALTKPVPEVAVNPLGGPAPLPAKPTTAPAAAPQPRHESSSQATVVAVAVILVALSLIAIVTVIVMVSVRSRRRKKRPLPPSNQLPQVEHHGGYR